MTAWWLLIGGLVGALNGLILRRTVTRLQPEAPDDATAWILVGAAFRWALIVGLLVVALQRGVAAGLLAFVGLWVVRWALIVWWNRSGAHPGKLEKS